MSQPAAPLPSSIKSLTPIGTGHHFVVYGDACSGRPGEPNERNFASVNAIVQRLEPPPGFILFTGDEVAGYTPNPDELRAQWRHWLDVEMRWLAKRAIPIWHATSNHTTYDQMSEGIFAEVLPHLPRNGPAGQDGLSYWVRQDDLLIVFAHTLASGLGGEGFVETVWLREVLFANSDAKHKIVVGHHPVFSVNGFSGAYGRDIGPECAKPFWDVLVEAGVLAYFCSHILAFDVQVHRGVLQVCTAGAGTGHRMPEGIEYLHCVQAALDDEGLRYQVLDTQGVAREELSWPVSLPSSDRWRSIAGGNSATPAEFTTAPGRLIMLSFMGVATSDTYGAEQTMLSAFDPGVQAKLWIGLRGAAQQLTVCLAPYPGRSPFYGLGPAIAPGEQFDLRILIHPGMGPGGFLFARGDDEPWTSMTSTSPWGPERLQWPGRLSVGYAQRGPKDRPFRGQLQEQSFVCF